MDVKTSQIFSFTTKLLNSNSNGCLLFAQLDGSGSGGDQEGGNDDDSFIVPLKTTPKSPPIQPREGVTDKESEVTVKYLVKTTTPSLSNCIQYSTHVMLISLLTLLVLSCRNLV